MSEIETLTPLLGALRDLVMWLKAKRTQGLIMGGVAASILGRPRVTHDIDVLVLLDEMKWEDFLAAGGRFGFVPRLTDPLHFAREAKVLLVRHKLSGMDVDVIFGALPFEREAIDHTVWVNIKGVRIPLPTPEDLIIMKAVAHRARDLADIESILDTHPKLNLRRIRKWVQEFSKAIEMPEIFSDLEKILLRGKKQKK